MTKIRENMAKAFAIFAGVFVVYIVLDWGMDITGRKSVGRQSSAEEIGKINGEPINYRDFAELVRQASENQKSQTGQEPDENQMRLIRDQVWNQFVEEQLYNEEAKRLGISVTDQEIVDWVRGDNPPPFLRQQFTDSLGNFRRQDYENAIQNPKNAKIWINVESYLRKQRLREKLQSVILAGVRVSDDDVMQRYVDNNVRYDADCLLFDPNTLVQDNEVTVTDDDLKKFYNENQEEFKQEATRKLKYVLFTLVATKADTDAVLNELNDVVQRVSEGANFTDLASTYSETPISDAFFKHGELNQERENAVFAAKAGDIIGPMQEADGYHLIKVLEFKDDTATYVKASHILIPIENNDSVKALKEAKDVYNKVKSGQDFAELAKQYSKDGSAQGGGDLGWFGKGKMVKPFEDASFKTKEGQITGPVKTQFGYHIIKVTGRDNRTVKIADIHVTAKPSSQTRETLSQQAQDLAYFAKQEDFMKVAMQNNFKVSETPAFQKNAPIPSIGTMPGLNKFAFEGKIGSVTDVITLPNGNFGVYMISEIKQAGFKPFEEVKASLQDRVKREKKMEKVKVIAENVRKSLSPTDSLSNAAGMTKPPASFQSPRSFTLNGFIPSIGRDPKLTGILSKMNIGDLSGAVEGTRGYYIVRLINKSPVDTPQFESQKNSLRTQILSERRSRLLSEWSDKLKKSAEIVDNRDNFYR